VKAARLREVTRAEEMAHQVRRWRDEGTPQFGDVLIHVLDYLGAINWAALENDLPESPEALAEAEDEAAGLRAQLPEQDETLEG